MAGGIASPTMGPKGEKGDKGPDALDMSESNLPGVPMEVHRFEMEQNDTTGWPVGPKFVNAKTLPTVHALAARGYDPVPGSHASDKFPYYEFLRIRHEIARIIALLETCQDIREEVEELRRRVRRWGTMLDRAVSSDADRIKFTGIFGVSVRALELSVIAGRALEARRRKSWNYAVERIETAACDWKDANSRIA